MNSIDFASEIRFRAAKEYIEILCLRFTENPAPVTNLLLTIDVDSHKLHTYEISQSKSNTLPFRLKMNDLESLKKIINSLPSNNDLIACLSIHSFPFKAIHNVIEGYTTQLPLSKFEKNKFKSEYRKKCLLDEHSDTTNIGYIFQLQDIKTKEKFSFHLNKNKLESAIGKSLLTWDNEEFIMLHSSSSETISYKILNRKKSRTSSHQNLSQHRSRTNCISADSDQRADGHMARENGAFGSFPLHDNHSDESTGNERDFEPYVEYIANNE